MSVRDVQYKLDSVLLEEISLHHTTFFVVEIHLKKPLELNNCKLLNMYIHRTTNFQLIPAAQHCLVFP